MRIDPKGTVAGWPALLARRALRRLRVRLYWTLGELESAASVTAGEGPALIKALLSEGLIEAAGRDAWKITQAGQTLSSATAAERVTRATAEKALLQFLGRVEQVNNDPYFLGKVTRVVLFGSMLKPEVDRLSDVDVAVELEKRATRGNRFRNFLGQEGCWYWEVFGFLKGHSRVIALADYAAEKSFVLKVPHRVLFGDAESTSRPRKPQRPVRNRRPRDCPF